MSLTAAVRTAQSSLTARAAQTAVASQNIAGASDPSYSRKLALAVTSDGGVQIVTTRRAADQSLFLKMLDATGTAAAQQAIVKSLDLLEQIVGDPELDRSPAAALEALASSIQQYSVAPSDTLLAQNVVDKAAAMARTLNDATAAVQEVRRQADAEIATSVETINGLLARFEEVNNAVVGGTLAGIDVTDHMDSRDRILAELSEKIGVSVVTRANNDTVIYTDSGVTLFETRPRDVRFAETFAFDAGITGNAVYVDGIPVTGDTAVMPIKSGQIQGLATIRDEAAISFQSQLDELARGLIAAFAESDQSDPPVLPDVPGLFTYSGAPAMPAAGIVVGLAGDIRLHPNVDPQAGGNPALLRDGGISGDPAYRSNVTGAAGYSDRLQQLLANLAEERPFDPAAGLGATGNLAGFAASSVSWLEAARQSATSSSDYQTALLRRTSEALSNATGVNLDDEMAMLLDLERSYQASSKLLAAVDGMFGSLLAALS